MSDLAPKTTKLITSERWLDAFLDHHAPRSLCICSLCGDDIEDGDGTDGGIRDTHRWCGQNADGGDIYGKD